MTPVKGIASGASADEAQSSATQGILGSMWRYKWLLLLGLTVGIGAGLFYVSQMIPEYQSSLKLLVVKKRPDLPLSVSADNRLTSSADYLGTHQIVLRSPVVISKAVKDGNLQLLPTFSDGQD